MAVNSPFQRSGNKTIGGTAAVSSMKVSTNDVLQPLGGGSPASVPSNPVSPDAGGRNTPTLPAQKPSVDLNAGSENNQRNTEVIGRLGGGNSGGGSSLVLDVPEDIPIAEVVADGAKEDKSFVDDDYFGTDNALDMGTGKFSNLVSNGGVYGFSGEAVSDMPVSTLAPAASVGFGVKKFDKKKIMIIAAAAVAVIIVIVLVMRGNGSKKRRR